MFESLKHVSHVDLVDVARNIPPHLKWILNYHVVIPEHLDLPDCGSDERRDHILAEDKPDVELEKLQQKLRNTQLRMVFSAAPPLFVEGKVAALANLLRNILLQ